MLLRLLPLTILLLSQGSHALDLDDYRLVDLSHTYDESTLFWPTSPTHFEKETLAYGKTDGGWFYSSYSVCTPEHGGTHVDAPIHFFEGGQTTDQIGLERLVTRAVVIDVTERAAENPDYQLTPGDVLAWEQKHGPIEPGSTVLIALPMKIGGGSGGPARVIALVPRDRQ